MDLAASLKVESESLGLKISQKISPAAAGSDLVTGGGRRRLAKLDLALSR